MPPFDYKGKNVSCPLIWNVYLLMVGSLDVCFSSSFFLLGVCLCALPSPFALCCLGMILLLCRISGHNLFVYWGCISLSLSFGYAPPPPPSPFGILVFPPTLLWCSGGNSIPLHLLVCMRGLPLLLFWLFIYTPSSPHFLVIKVPPLPYPFSSLGSIIGCVYPPSSPSPLESIREVSHALVQGSCTHPFSII